MEFRLLGAVEIVLSDRVLDIGPPQRRLVLAILAAEAGRPVSTESLVDRVWDEAPDRARRTLQVHISRIRRLLETTSEPVKVVRRSGGYLLDVAPDRVDALRFRRLVDRARSGDRPELERVALLGQALDLWRGLPLSDLPGEWAARARQGWQQQYLEAVRAWALACLQTADPGAVLARLSELVTEHPLVESLTAVYMRALYAAGRPADALEHYTMVRRHLAEELGADPGPELQQLHRQILSADPALDTPATAAADRLTDPPTGTHVPAQLPADVSAFTGRAEQLAHLDALLARAGDQPTAVIISALSGTAGVGKTALAIHWAHRIRDRFPDGQLYVNLRGYDPDQPTDPGEALTRFLSALGVTGQEVPNDLDDRVARYRSEIADRRMLIVLDNAGSVEQIRPLLPGSSSSTVVVTSRDRLAGLIAVHGAHRLDLDLLPLVEAVTLLRRLVGLRIDAEPEAAATLADHCARLPLALRVAAELAVSRPASPLAELVAELDDQQRRLDLLDGGDPHAAVRTVFSWSIQRLPPDAASTFRLLGLHPGLDIDPYAAAALAGTSVEVAHRRLDLLTRAHLLHPAGPGRYAMHDLLRAYSAELTRTQDTEQIRSAAQGQLLDHYRHTASVAMDTAYPYERARRPRIPPVDTPTPDLSDPNQAAGWLDIEHPNLLAAVRHAADHGWPAHALDLSTILHRHLRTRGRYSDAEALHHLALTAARTVGDRAGELAALNGLGWACVLQGRPEQAIDYNQLALEIARTIGDRAGELNALHGIAYIHLVKNRHEPAIDHYQRGLEIAHTVGDRAGQMDALIGLADLRVLQGQYEPAIDHFRQALEIARATGHRDGEMYALHGLAHVHLRDCQYEPAIDHFQQALEIARATGHRVAELGALTGLADLHRLQGRHKQAADHYQQVLDLARETSNRNWQFEALQGLGRLHHTTANPDAAMTHHRQALALATELGQPADQARAHDGLAHAHQALNQSEQARQYWHQALDIFTSLGTDHTSEPEVNTTTIRAYLAE
jgi:DNA-binding SARP family transcriptional activator/Tfp pilus assembly protein PilF